ncbi:MAG: hypothetical protein V3V96_15575 [Acidiferrobacterales bacterium]
MTIIEELEDKRVLGIRMGDSRRTVRLREACDDYFYMHLNKAGLGRFVAELMAIHFRMEE